MSPRTSSQVNKIRKDRKYEILNSALEVFAENGYLSSSMSKIAQHAGISKGLIYNYFNSKEELVKEIIKNGFNSMMQKGPFDENSDMNEERFKLFVHNTFSAIKSNINFWKLYYSLAMQPNVIKIISEEIISYATPFFNSISAYYKSKGIENPDAEVRVLAATLDGAAMYYIFDPDNFPLKDVEDIIINKFK